MFHEQDELYLVTSLVADSASRHSDLPQATVTDSSKDFGTAASTQSKRRIVDTTFRCFLVCLNDGAPAIITILLLLREQCNPTQQRTTGSREPTSAANATVSL